MATDLKRQFGKFCKAGGPLVLTAVLTAGGTAGIVNWADHDIDGDRSVAANEVTENLKDRLNDLRSLQSEYSGLQSSYKLATDAGDRETAASYEAQIQELKDKYTADMDAYKADLLLSPEINEITYRQFHEVTPNTRYGLGNGTISLNINNDSLNECRAEYQNNVAASRLEIARNVSSCMAENDSENLFPLGLFTFMGTAAFGMMISVGLQESKTVSAWARRPKPAKEPKQNN